MKTLDLSTVDSSDCQSLEAFLEDSKFVEGTDYLMGFGRGEDIMNTLGIMSPELLNNEEFNTLLKECGIEMPVPIKQEVKKQVVQLLDNISCEAQELTMRDFKEYINDYTGDPVAYGIDVQSEYFKALQWAKLNLTEAYFLLRKLK